MEYNTIQVEFLGITYETAQKLRSGLQKPTKRKSEKAILNTQSKYYNEVRNSVGTHLEDFWNSGREPEDHRFLHLIFDEAHVLRNKKPADMTTFLQKIAPIVGEENRLAHCVFNSLCMSATFAANDSRGVQFANLLETMRRLSCFQEQSSETNKVKESLNFKIGGEGKKNAYSENLNDLYRWMENGEKSHSDHIIEKLLLLTKSIAEVVVESNLYVTRALVDPAHMPLTDTSSAIITNGVDNMTLWGGAPMLNVTRKEFQESIIAEDVLPNKTTADEENPYFGSIYGPASSWRSVSSAHFWSKERKCTPPSFKWSGNKNKQKTGGCDLGKTVSFEMFKKKLKEMEIDVNFNDDVSPGEKLKKKYKKK